jgi:hypothetical protein
MLRLRSVSRSLLVSSSIWGPRPDCHYCQTLANLLVWSAFSDERTGLLFTIAAGPKSHRTHGHILLSQIQDFPNMEQSRAVAYCRQPANTVTLGIEPRWDPWPYICSVLTLLVPPPPPGCSSFHKREGLGFFYNWCSSTTPYSTRGHIKVWDIYILYIFTKHKLTLSSTTYRDICQCRIVQQLMPQLIRNGS